MISMEVFMDIFALKRNGYSLRAIARKLGIHRNTVKKYLQSRDVPKYCQRASRDSVLDDYKHTLQDYLQQDQYAATWLYERIKRMGYTGSYELVKCYVRGIKQQQQRLAYIRFETEPGRQAQVDWADFQVLEPDGSTSTLYVFVIVLGFSRGMYFEFVKQCTLEQFMDCHIHAFHYFGGIPAEILYDNMKHVVTGRKDGKPQFNSEFLHFAHHYGFQPIACPPYSPWVKGKAERPIDYFRERFWRGYRYEGLDRANRDALRWLDEVANRRVHGTHHQVVLERLEQERARLGQLPTGDYDTSLKVFRKVYRDCQVSYNTNRYVVPHTVVGKQIMLKVKNAVIRFYDDDQLLATYHEATGKHQLVGDPRFYEQLREDRSQQKRKYGRCKGKATRGLTTPSLYPQVQYRPVSDYDHYSKGGAPWNN